MKLVVQRVSRAAVRVEDEVVGRIGAGLLLLIAVEREDTEEDRTWCAEKVVGMRIFADADGKMNLSVGQVGGSILAVSQFTLAGSLRRGRRPSFVGAAPPEEAEPAYDGFLDRLRAADLPVESGIFRAHMEVELVNDGPVTILLDSGDRRQPRGGPLA